jgi:hypothetical protein
MTNKSWMSLETQPAFRMAQNLFNIEELGTLRSSGSFCQRLKEDAIEANLETFSFS